MTLKIPRAAPKPCLNGKRPRGRAAQRGGRVSDG